MIEVYLVDDEPLALRRLERMLGARDRIHIAGSCSDPARALAELTLLNVDAVFLDIQMPEMTGFDLLARLATKPLVVFTTAYDQYALRAFEFHSIDYLLKPVDEAQLDRALAKLGRTLAGEAPRPELTPLLAQLRSLLQQPPAKGDAPERIASKIGERVHFLELSAITHFYAEDKLTYAATPQKKWVIDRTIAELEQKLDPQRFCRVHRSTLVNLAFVDELYPWFGGKMIVRLKDPARTEITVARERLKDLKDRLGI